MNIKPHTGEVTAAMMALLLLADPDEKAVSGYINSAKRLVALDGERLVGVAAVVGSGATFELKNIAVAPEYQGKGIAKQLISQVKSEANISGATTLIVGTGNSSLSQLALYQKCGFRLSRIKPDFFADYPQPIFENGIRCLDLVVLEMKL